MNNERRNGSGALAGILAGVLCFAGFVGLVYWGLIILTEVS